MKTKITGIVLYVVFGVMVLEAQSTGWFKAIGGPYVDYGKHGLQMDDRYFLIGTHGSSSTKDNIWLVKADSVGDTLWTMIYSFGLDDNMGLHMQRSSDNCLFLAGGAYSDSTDWDAAFIKVDTSGNPLQSYLYGGASSDWSEAVCATYDGGCALTGVTFSYGSGESDVFLIRLDSNGDTMWVKTYGGSSYDQGFAVKQTPDSGFVIAGWNGTDNYHARVLFMKTDPNGNAQWTHYWGSTSGESKGMDVCLTADGGYLLAGYTDIYGAGSHDAWLLKVNASGDTVWSKTFGGTGSDFIYSIGPAADNNYVMAGGTDSYGNGNYDLWLIKVTPDGNLLWQRFHGYEQYEWGESVEPTSDGGYVIVGRTNSIGSGDYDLLFVTTDSLGNLPVGIGEQVKVNADKSRLNVYPNPFINRTAVYFCTGHGAEGMELKIYDVSGKMVRDLTSSVPRLSSFAIWNGEDALGCRAPAGVYFLHLDAAGRSITEKIVKLK